MYRVTKEFQFKDRDDLIGTVESYEEACMLTIKDFSNEVPYIRAWGDVNKEGEYRDLGSHSFLYKIIKC